ncbi:hypothetical protein Pgin01_01161 [Porphyromonas gingivalis]
MARATTKQDLIMASNGQFEKLWVLIDGMSDDLQNATFADQMATAGKEAHWGRDKNLRDVLVHLYEWHQLLLNETFAWQLVCILFVNSLYNRELFCIFEY